MTAYYNEIDPVAAEWLRNLISKDLIAPGDVDERDIKDVKPNELFRYTQCHFFAGIGIWSLALRARGWPDDRPVWTGSAPCQPHSGAASERAKGFADERDLFPVWFDKIENQQPIIVLGEQVDDSAAWISRTQDFFKRTGYAFGAVDFPACAAGAPIERMRTYFVAFSNCSGQRQQSWPLTMAPEYMAIERPSGSSFYGDHRETGELGRIRRVKPGLRLLADGYPGRVAELRAFGNAINGEAAKSFIGAVMNIETDWRRS